MLSFRPHRSEISSSASKVREVRCALVKRFSSVFAEAVLGVVLLAPPTAIQQLQHSSSIGITLMAYESRETNVVLRFKRRAQPLVATLVMGVRHVLQPMISAEDVETATDEAIETA